MNARRDRLDRRLLLAGVVGGPLFLAVFTIEGARRDGYEPLREPVSALALGERGWVQQANFLVTGSLMLACSQGLRRLPSDHPARSWWGSRLLALYALGLLGSGIFVTDPVCYGKPDPALPVVPSRAGVLHNLFGLQVFGALTAASWVYARRFAAQGERGLAVASALTGVLVPGSMIAFGQGLGRDDGLGRVAGLFQRLAIATGWSWVTVLALFARRGARR